MEKEDDKRIIRQFAIAVRNRRLAIQMTQETLAELAGLRLNTIGEIERGESNPYLTTVSKISRALRCTPGDLIP